MARPQTLLDWQVDRAAALIACGGDVDALGETFGVRPATLRRRIRDRFGGMPAVIPTPPCESWLEAAAALLDGLNTAADSTRLQCMARACREAAADAAARNAYILAVGSGNVATPIEGS